MKVRSCLSMAAALGLAPTAESFVVPRSYFSGSQTSSLFLEEASSGPKAAGRRRQSPRSSSSSAGPQTERQPRQRPQKQVARLFDGKAMAAVQAPNEDALPLDLEKSMLGEKTIRCMTPDISMAQTVAQPAFTFLSLDDLFGLELGLSAKFNSDCQFRQDLRMAIRQDIFDTTPYYASLSEKIASILLLPDSSLEGSWRSNAIKNKPHDDDDDDASNIRMKHTTQVLQEAFGEENAPTGDELFQAIGNLCGSKPSTHWIDIYGVQDRKINHSWHLDFGKSPRDDSRTVLWGFPSQDDYEGCGVFSHVVPLQQECLAPADHPRNEPVLFDGTVAESHIVRPKYAPGRELLMYRDIDVLHSAPDITYRTSVMRFM
jgi:hypothetical protein